jgi:hypothetical protein
MSYLSVLCELCGKKVFLEMPNCRCLVLTNDLLVLTNCPLVLANDLLVLTNCLLVLANNLLVLANDLFGTYQ